MKKTLLGASLTLLAGNAMAADGTIHFTGSITDHTCTIDTGSQNLPVNLGNVALSSLNGAKGMRAAPTKFTINVTDCPATVSGASVKFGGISDSYDQSLLALDRGNGNATGVGIQIADNNGTAIPLHTASTNYTLATGANSLDFVASYVSTGPAVTTGAANGTSEFTIVYK